MFFNKKFESININDLDVNDSTKIIDVRTASEYRSNHLKKAKNVELNSLLANPESYLSKEVKYYIVCQSGMRSSKACKVLSKLGYNVVNLKGGMSSYHGRL